MWFIVPDQSETVRSGISITVHNDSVAFEVDVAFDSVLLPGSAIFFISS